jgi:hypothetical protein
VPFKDVNDCNNPVPGAVPICDSSVPLPHASEADGGTLGVGVMETSLPHTLSRFSTSERDITKKTESLLFSTHALSLQP